MIRVKKKINIYLLSIFTISMLFNSIKLLSYISFIAYIYYWFNMLWTDKAFIIKYLAFIFNAVGCVVGVAIIELFPSFYMIELNVNSHFSGSLPFIIYFYYIFIELIHILEGRHETKSKIVYEMQRLLEIGCNKKVITYGTLISLVFLGSLALRTIIVSPPAFIFGIDRFTYATNYAVGGIWGKISTLSYLLLIFPLLSILYNRNKWSGFAAIFCYVLYTLWVGNKFGSLFSLMCLLLLVFSERIMSLPKKVLNRILFLGGIILVAMILVAIVLVSNGGNGAEYFGQRASQQGQLWWSIYDQFHNNAHPEKFGIELKAILEGERSVKESIGCMNGIYGMMYLSAPKALIDYKLSLGIRYAQAGFAASYYYFGFVGAMLYAIFGSVIVYFTTHYFVQFLNEQKYICAFMTLRIYMLFRAAFGMYLFANMFDAVSILSYILLFLLSIFTIRIQITENDQLFKKIKQRRIS